MIVPTVERGFWPDDFCEIEIDGLRPRDEIDVGLGHLPEKLPGEARQAFDVAPLPFGIQRVERQRALARAAHAGQANQLVARQNEVDVPQIMLAGPFDDDIRGGHAEAGQQEKRWCTSVSRNSSRDRGKGQGTSKYEVRRSKTKTILHSTLGRSTENADAD